MGSGGGKPDGFTSSLMGNDGAGAPVKPVPGVGGGKVEGVAGFSTSFCGAPVSFRPARGGGGGAGGNPPGVDGIGPLSSSSFFSSADPSSVFSSSVGASSSFFLSRPNAPLIFAKKPTFGASSSVTSVGASVGSFSDGASEGSFSGTPSSFMSVGATLMGGVMSFFSAYAGTFSGAGMPSFVTSGSTMIVPPMSDNRGNMIKIHALRRPFR